MLFNIYYYSLVMLKMHDDNLFLYHCKCVKKDHNNFFYIFYSTREHSVAVQEIGIQNFY